MIRRILVTGASVAGNAAAWWLGRYGFDVTVVERAQQFRDGGQNIDVRGVGREVLRRMELEQQALAAGTGELGTAWINRRGGVAARFMAGGTGGEGPTAEMEILRGDLARLMFEAARERAGFRFGDTVARIEQDADGVSVGFASGARERYDLVVVAEGVGSDTRELVFPGENQPRWMDLAIAYFTIPRAADDDRMWRWYHTTGGRSVSLRPDRHGTTRASLIFRGTPNGEQVLGAAEQKALLRRRFADAGWQAERVLDGMETTQDFYFDVLRQVRMKRWSNGRVVLTGDAAWCVTPLGGFGTTLAVTGACVLAGELQRSPDPATALARFEAAMRPVVDQAQGVPKAMVRIMNPDTRIGIRAMHAGLNLASRPALLGIAGRVFASHREGPDLSGYAIPDRDRVAAVQPEA